MGQHNKHSETATLLKEVALRANGGQSGRIDSSQVPNLSEELEVLVEYGFMKPVDGSDETMLQISEEGMAALQTEYRDYAKLFQHTLAVEMIGRVTDGAGRGGDFISLRGYTEQFKDKLGYSPYAGTLNLTLPSKTLCSRRSLSVLEGIRIEEWSEGGTEYGGGVCYPATLKVIGEGLYDPTHVFVPDRTDHDPNHVEIIAPVRLRDKLNLNNGEKVGVHVGKS